MPRIECIYLVNHSHTDIGYTDQQDLIFRQHGEFIDEALDLIEATQHLPEEARYRWTCEITGTTERYLRQAPSRQVERFLHWNREGYLDVAGMQYHLTPMLNIEQMIRSLYPVQRLRREFGLTISAAMQCDVNGVSWIFADLLREAGIDFLTMAVNMGRGGVPKPLPGLFWWESPSGQKLLTWNGFHYLWGRSIARIGDWRFVERSLPAQLAKIESNPSYPFDFLYAQATHPMRVDNGPPDIRMSEFVERWNAEGRHPRIELTTPRQFSAFLHARDLTGIETRRGDWVDFWADGVASSAVETGVSRATHESLLEAEMIAAWLVSKERPQPWSTDRAAQTYETATLYDEHTWGAFASISAPDSLWSRSQWSRKADFAYSASSEALDMVTRSSRAFAETVANPGPEGVFNLGDLAPEEAYTPSGADAILVLNTLPWARRVSVVEPQHRGWAAPAGLLESEVPRAVRWGGARPETPNRRIDGEVPAFGYAFLPISAAATNDGLAAGEGWIENERYRVEIDPLTGGLKSWFDKQLGHEFAGSYQGWRPGQYVHEQVDSPEGRAALFVANYTMEDFGYGRTDTPWDRSTVTSVSVAAPVIENGRVSIDVEVAARGIRWGRCTFSLGAGEAALNVDWLVDKEEAQTIEAVFVAFPFNLGEPRFRADVNGIPFSPNADQIPGSVTDWYPVGRWIDVSDAQFGVTIAPLDAPLFQLGGITTGRWAKTLEPDGPTLMSWAMNNHWFVNFRAFQTGRIPLRYRLTTHAGGCNDVVAARFGAEESTPPIVLRDYLRTDASTASHFSVSDDAEVLVTAKPAEDGDGVILRLQHLRATAAVIPVAFPLARVASAGLTDALEGDLGELAVEGNVVRIELGPLAVQSIRVRFGREA